MEKKLLAVSVLAAVLIFIWGGRVSAQVNPDHAAILAQAEAIVQNVPRIIAAEQAAYEAGMANQRHQQRQAPLPSLPIPPVARQQPVAKPPVVAAPVEKPQKVVEQAKAQAPPVKPPQSPTPPLPPRAQAVKPSERSQEILKIIAMRVPTEEKDILFNDFLCKKGETWWAWSRVALKNGKEMIVDKDGNPTQKAELSRSLPSGAEIEITSFKLPNK